MMNPYQNSTNKFQTIYLKQITYPGENRDSYYLTENEVNELYQQGLIPEIKIKGLDENRPKIAVILARNKHPERLEKDYYLNPEIAEAITAAGGYPVFIAYDKITEQLNHLNPDGMLLIGGAFDTPKEWYDIMPEEDTDKRGYAYLEMVEYARKNKLPTLGICAGYQVIAGMNGATLKKNINEGKALNHKQGGYKIAHTIQIKPGSLLAEILGDEPLAVNSDHNEAVCADKPGECFVTAVAKDGIAEALELKHPWNRFVLGVQWHPECHYKASNQDDMKLFKALVKAAADE